jgi:hypothetical protein
LGILNKEEMIVRQQWIRGTSLAGLAVIMALGRRRCESNPGSEATAVTERQFS